MFKFNPKKLSDKEIGHGEYGTVYPYRKSKDDRRWVVKSIDVTDIEELAEFMQVVALSFNHDHPNILPVVGYNLQGETGANKLHIKMPRVKESLGAKIDRYRNQGEELIELEEVIAHLYDAAKGLEYLENKRISHQDLKPGNILLDNKGKAMIADIGMPRGIENAYVAPEMDSGEQRMKKEDLYKGDVWSLGVIMIELCLLEPESMSGDLEVDKLKKNIYANLSQISKKYGKDLANLLGKLVDIDPQIRPSFKEIQDLLERQYMGLDRKQSEEHEGRQVFEEAKEEKKKPRKEERREPEREETMETAPKSQRSQKSQRIQRSRENVEEKHEYKIMSKLDLIKKELEEKWEQHFRFERDEQWGVTAKKPSHITDVELDIFLFDASEKLREAKVTDIKRLVMNLTNCNQVSNTGMTHIAKHVASHFSNAQELKLDFGGCDQINDMGMTQLVNQISQQLITLQRLALDFSYWIKITDSGLHHVSTYLGHFTDLKHLKLNFNYTNITDNGIAQLATEIGNKLSKLEHLTLNFGGCMNITDTALTQISAQIGQQLTKLQHLAINVSFCPSITDVGLMHFASNTPKNLKQLKHLWLDFGGCTEITDKGVTSLATHIAHDLKTLERLTLDFQACNKVTAKPKELLKKTLSFIPNIDIK